MGGRINYINRLYVLKEGDVHILTVKGTKYVKYKQEDVKVLCDLFL